MLEQFRLWLTSRWARYLLEGAVLLLTGGVLGTMVLRAWPMLAAYHWEVRLWPLGLAVGAYPVALALAVYAWGQIVRHLGGELSFPQHFRIYALTLVAARLPGAPWHIAGRAALYKSLGISRRIILLASGLELVMVISAGAVTGLLILPLTQQNQQWLWVVLLLAAIAGIVIVHPSVIRRVLQLLGREDTEVKLSGRRLLLVLAVYVLDWAVGGVILYTLILTIYRLPLNQILWVIGAWGLSGATASIVLVVPSGLGVREITLSFLLGLIVPQGIAPLVAVLARIFFTAIELVMSLVVTVVTSRTSRAT